MDIKVKSLLSISFTALFLAGCTTTDGRYTTGQEASATGGQAGVKHTHNGVAHTHPLPEGGLSHSHNYNSGAATNTCAPCAADTTRTPVVNIPVTTNTGNTSANGNSHVHNGRRHSHPLPASGTNHQHRQGTGNQGTGTVVNTQPQQPVQPQQPANTTVYDYSGGSSSTGTSYYNYGGSKGNAANNNVTHSHNGRSHSHTLPAAGTNHTHQGATSFGGGNTGGGSNGSVYVVKPKDTVFQVMRNTGVYWKTIIKLNNLQAPDYTISPGQRLKLK